MAKGLCNCTHRLWDAMERQERWIQCRKPANHLGDHYNPPNEKRWPNE